MCGFGYMYITYTHIATICAVRVNGNVKPGRVYTRWSSRYIHIYRHLPYHDVGMCISLPAATQSCPALNVAALIVGTCIMVASLLYQPPRDLSSRARSRPSFPSTAASDISFGAAASLISARRIRTRAPSPPLPASTSSKSAPSPLARL